MSIGAIAHWDHKEGLEPVGRRLLYQCYDYSSRGFGAELMMVEIDPSLPDDVLRKATLAQALEHFAGYTPVYIHKTGSVPLGEFTHPVGDTVYIVGPDYQGMGVNMEGELVVSIEMDDMDVELWAHVALAIVLRDRIVKGG